MRLRGAVIALCILVLGGAGAFGLVRFLNARDAATIGRGAEGPGSVRTADGTPQVRAGNVVLLYADPAIAAPLRNLASDIAGPPDPALTAAGQAVLVRRDASVRVPVLAVTANRRLEAAGARDPQLRAFVEFWLGRDPR